MLQNLISFGTHYVACLQVRILSSELRDAEADTTLYSNKPLNLVTCHMATKQFESVYKSFLVWWL